jgi:glutamate dehydrogenase
MIGSVPATTAAIIHPVLDLVAERLDGEQAGVVAEFVRLYYARTAAEDLEGRDPIDLYGAALAHWSFARSRAPGQPKVRIYNPDFGRHAWQSTHSVVEIVADDMPFLVDSVRMALNRHGLTMHLIIHPIMSVARDAAGELIAIAGPDAPLDGGVREAIMHFEFDRQTDAEVLEGITAEIEKVLGDVRAAVEDWSAMRGRLRAILAELDTAPPPLPADELSEGRAFLEWIDDEHFTYLGYREYQLIEEAGEAVLRRVPNSGLGLLRDHGEAGVSRAFTHLTPDARRLAAQPQLLIITKANTRSTVHRPTHLDYIGVKRFDGDGRVIGERRFVGLYTSAAYNRIPRVIPLLRRKVQHVVERAGYPDASHAAKVLVHILETFPRDELFQVSEERLYETAMGILHLQERQRIRLFVHRDPFGRFYSCIVYVPRDRFNTEIRLAIQRVLVERLNAQDIEFTVELSESVLARLYFVFWTSGGQPQRFDVADLEARLREVIRSWSDDLRGALIDHYGEERGMRLYRRYAKAFDAGYREDHAARIAVLDIDKIEELQATPEDISMTFYRRVEAPEDAVHLKLFRIGSTIALSDALPMLENMDLKVETETASEVEPAGAPRAWIHDFAMRLRAPGAVDLDAIRERFQDAFAEVWHGRADDDGFNRLVLRAGLDWAEIAVLRAYCKFLRQANVPFSLEYMMQTLAAQRDVATQLIALFHARFNPAPLTAREARIGALAEGIRGALDAIASLDEDRILRSLLELILATLRTNYYQLDAGGRRKPYLSFKLDSARIPDLPKPRPMFEIFVYSPAVEGVHLRGGRVARGGLRWSDRREDYRTEVLGLMKAQMVKNAVIVPVGSKGGFIVKRLPSAGSREALRAAGVEAYKTFIRGLLDLTDNLAGGEVVPPPGVLRHDGDDPYLVVAADKGTASFSDIANGVAAEYGFWLGDAFASGGTHGYDHKKMGITARGAWEAVRRHFRDLGHDTQAADFTAVGIGDMAGDVFGNGMLQSEHIRLVAAFNHQHVFIDPDPDPRSSFEERKRLFELPRSSWDDYDRSRISKGGGVFARTAKSISLSAEARRALATTVSRATPNELIRIVLQAPVDLLWNGGIGTYVKASDEPHEAAGDRGNDAVRVNAAELRARVVAEGGNLGFTQRARIEFARRGGRINTDAIDNSGGVNCSDYEVNIKILLNGVVADGDLTGKQRNSLLAEMTGEVARLVLRNNSLQTRALGTALSQAPMFLDAHVRLLRYLEREAGLDRAIEFLPGAEEIDERRAAGQGLTVPELAVLMAYVKTELKRELLESDLPDAAALAGALVEYFPAPLGERYRDRIARHRLSREILSTVVANDLVNRGGISFAFRLAEETGAKAPDIARAFLGACRIFGLPQIWSQIEGLDGVIESSAQIGMITALRKLLEHACRWLLRHYTRGLNIEAAVARYRPGIDALSGGLPGVLPQARAASLARRTEELTAAGVPGALAGRVAAFDECSGALDIIETAHALRTGTDRVAAVYFALAERLGLQWVLDQVLALPRDDLWRTLARAAMCDDLYGHQIALTRDALAHAANGGADALIGAWIGTDQAAFNRCRQMLGDLQVSGSSDFTQLAVALRQLQTLRITLSPKPAAG